MASAVAHQTICWPQVYKRKPKIYCVVCGQYTKPSRQGKKLYKCVDQECKNRIHAECNNGISSFDCTLVNLALLRKQEGSVKEKITFESDNADLFLQNRSSIGHIESLVNLALLRKQEGSVKEKITFEPDGANLLLQNMSNIEHIANTECERLKLQENNECDKLLKKGETLIHELGIEEINKLGYEVDKNNNSYGKSHQHRKEHKRKAILSNDETTDDDNSLVESQESNKKTKQDYKDSYIKTTQHRKEHKRKNILIHDKTTGAEISVDESLESKNKANRGGKDMDNTSTQHRKEHKRKSLSDLENTAYPKLDTEMNEHFEMNRKANKICDASIKQLYYDKEYSQIGELCEDLDYEEPYLELLEQLYFKGHVTDRNRKKYMRKWRKHKKKRKRNCKKVKHFPTAPPNMEENVNDQDTEDVIVGSDTNNSLDQPCAARYADIYNELYDDYRYSSNKPPEDENFLYLVRENNKRNLQPFELPQLTYIIDNTDPDEYLPPDHYFE